MVIETFVFLDVVQLTSKILAGASFFFLATIFGDTLFLRFDLKTFLKSLGFFILSGAMFVTMVGDTYQDILFWIMSAAFSMIFVGFVIDPLSRFRFLTPLPLLFFPFLKGHILLFVLASITTGAIFGLAYTMRHRDLIPLGVGFTLLAAGEYLYHLETIERLRQLGPSGSFLYLFAAVILLGWGWSYLVMRFVSLLRLRKA